MAYYAFLNDENIVVEVIPGRDEDELGIDWEVFYSGERGLACKRTSFNTRANSHADGKEPFRYNFGEVGFSYNAEKDAFIPPKPFSSWILNENTCRWTPPVPYPQEGNWYWNEELSNWSEIVES